MLKRSLNGKRAAQAALFLLQFFEDNGTPRDAWVPGWNVLSLFDVRHVHSVTYVAPFAGAPRLSITGWFRAGPRQAGPR